MKPNIFVLCVDWVIVFYCDSFKENFLRYGIQIETKTFLNLSEANISKFCIKIFFTEKEIFVFRVRFLKWHLSVVNRQGISSFSIFCRFLPQLDHFPARCDGQLKPIKRGRHSTFLNVLLRPFSPSTQIINSLLNHQVLIRSNSFSFYFQHFLRPVSSLRPVPSSLFEKKNLCSHFLPFIHKYLTA